MRRLLVLLPLLASIAVAQESPLLDRDVPVKVARGRHYILEAEHVLRDSEREQLAAEGVEIQRALPGNRYVIRVTGDDTPETGTNVRAVTPIRPAQKVASSAMHAAAESRTTFTRLNVIFHDDVSFDDARAAIAAAGGSLEAPMAVSFEEPRRLRARVPAGSLTALAADDRIAAMFGPLPKMRVDNIEARALSEVDVVQSTYNLTGAGQTLSLFELAAADGTHSEFGGRLNVTFSGGSAGDRQHATHVAGTMAAAGLRPRAEGMSPAATVYEYNACDSCDWLGDKKNKLPGINSVADNNSWGYIIGWWGDDPDAGGLWTWTGNGEYFGAYEYIGAALDKIARNGNTLFVHSSGNEADKNGPQSAPFQHRHQDDNGSTIKDEIFCYSQNGSGNDCPAPPTCSSGLSHCETVRHRPNGPYTSTGFIPSAKNLVSVGAVDVNKQIADFSSRGPTRDGRVKPDLVAKGVRQYSTFPSESYGTLDGTSMSSPVVTGISGVVAQQWKQTFNTAITPMVLKGLLIAGAVDIPPAGPDYTYGFGLVDAKNSVDLIRDDGAQGRRIRVSSVATGGVVDVPFTVTSAKNVRVLLTWFDPEVLIVDPNEIVDRALLNDLDLKVVGPTGDTVLPYVLDGQRPDLVATRGVNKVDTVEEVEIANAAPGTYHAIVTGTTIASGGSQQFVVIANADIGASAPACSDSYEPNDDTNSAFGFVASKSSVQANACAGDVDYFKFRSGAGNATVNVTAGGTPLKVTLSTDGLAPATTTIAAGGSGFVSMTVPANAIVYIRVEANGSQGTTNNYTVTPTFPLQVSSRTRTARH